MRQKYLDFRMIRRNTEPYQAEWNRQTLVHVDFSIFYLVHDPIRRVEAGWSRSDDSQTERSILV